MVSRCRTTLCTGECGTWEEFTIASDVEPPLLFRFRPSSSSTFPGPFRSNPTCIDGPTVIVPAYMEVRITALKNMNVNHLHYGVHFSFDLSLRTGGLPQSVRDHIIQDISLQVV